MYCKHCGNQIGDADVCLKCRHSVKKGNEKRELSKQSIMEILRREGIMKKIFGIFVYCILIVGITGCGSESVKEVNVIGDLNKIHAECLEQNESHICNMNWTLQEYLKSYSSYELLNASNKEFTTKPQEPNSQFTYGTSRDALCDYHYALFYNKDNESYYAVEYDCEDNKPTFTKSTLLK